MFVLKLKFVCGQDLVVGQSGVRAYLASHLISVPRRLSLISEIWKEIEIICFDRTHI